MWSISVCCVKLKTLLSYLDLQEADEKDSKKTTIDACENIKISLWDNSTHIDKFLIQRPKEDQDLNEFAL